MKTSTLIALFITIASFSFGQHPTCDGSRYLDANYSVDQTLGVQYGNATTVNGVNTNLKFDFFEPNGDAATSRPLIILAFGGSFIGGAREDMHEFCNYYAERGYACATIDYRLYDLPLLPLPDSVDMTDEVVKALSDMKAAIRFFKEDAANANTYRVDPNFIIVGGISAGGIVAAHAGMLDPTDPIASWITPLITNNGGWQGNSSTNTEYNEDVIAVLNYSGALKSADYIDASDVPLFSVHDDNDGTVPYAYGSGSIFAIPIISLEGSFLMDQKAQSVGLNSELITYANSNGHVSYFNSNPVATDSILTRSLNFMYPLICGIGADVETIDAAVDFRMYPNPAQASVTIEMENTQDFTISICDVAGRKVLSTQAKSGKSVLSLEGFNSGVYFVEVVNEQNGTRERKHLVIN